MPEKTIHFRTLGIFRDQLKKVDSWDRLHECFIQIGEDLSAEITVELLTDEHDGADDVSEKRAVIPIPATSYAVRITAVSPPISQDDVLFAQLGASLLSHAPLFQATHASLHTPQLSLIRLLGQTIAHRQQFSKFLEVMSQNMPAAFPKQQAGRLLLWHKDSSKLTILGTFGQTRNWQAASDSVSVSEPYTSALSAKEMITRENGIEQQFVFPISVEGRVLALLETVYEKKGDIPPADLVALPIIAEQISTALSYKQLSEQAGERTHQLEIIYRVTESVRSLMPLELTLVEIHKQLLDAFSPPTCFIALVDKEAQLIRFPCVWENNLAVSRAPISIQDENSLVAWVISHNMPYATEDWRADEGPVAGIEGVGDARSIICVPMRVGDEVLGIISIQDNEPGRFDASAYQMLTAVAAHVAVIVKNARLYTTARELVDKGARDYQTAVALRQAIASISTSLEQDEVLSRLLTALDNLIQYRRASVLVWQDGRFVHVVESQFNAIPILRRDPHIEQIWQDSEILQIILRTQEPLCLRYGQENLQWPAYPQSDRVRTWLGIPIQAGDTLVGVLMIDSDKNDAFDAHEEWLVSSLTAHAGVAYQNARLYQMTQEQLAELETLHQASAMMTSNLVQDSVLQTVATEMVRALNVDCCTIFVWDESRQILVQSAHESHQMIAQMGHPHEIGLGVVKNLERNQFVQDLLEQKQIKRLRLDEAKTADERALLAASKLKALMLVPLFGREGVLGLLALGQFRQPRLFDEQNMRLAKNLASQAGVAIEHAHLFSKAQRRVDELSEFNDIVLQLNTPLKLNAVLDAITESALKLTEATNLHIYLYDPDTQEFLKGSALWRDGRRTAAVKKLRSEGKGLTATVVTTGKPIVINDAANHPFFQAEPARSWGICAIAGFPLKYGEQVIGAFTITYLNPHTFSQDELLLLGLLAKQAAVAVRNAELFSNSQRRLRDMSALVDMAKQITSDLKLQSVLQTTVQMLRDLLNARASAITMLSDDDTELIVKAADGVNPEFINARMDVEGSVSGNVIRTQQLVYMRDTHSDPNFVFFDDVVRSLLVVPLVIRDKPIGTLSVDSDKPNIFSESDVQLMTIAASQVSVAISNAHLFEQLEARATELKAAYDELKESDRLKDELVQNVSHELRTPLTFVKGYSDLLLDGEMGLLQSAQQEALVIIADKTNEITRIIDDIITLQRIDAGNLNLKPESMSEMLNTAVMNHQLVADKKGLNIKLMLPNEDGMVYIDKQRINQVLDNLLSNAMKFSPGGGTITVSMSVDKGQALVAVADEGIGISPEQHDRIFERFYQIDGSARRRFGGTGIGLAIVKRIIDAHNGKIWVKSELDSGSAFYFMLPLALENVTKAIPQIN